MAAGLRRHFTQLRTEIGRISGRGATSTRPARIRRPRAVVLAAVEE